MEGVIVERSTWPPFLETSVSWMYSRTSFFSRGMTITLPDSALWIAQRMRISGKSVIGMMSSTP